ncbi:MAG: GGDEF domain-containing protein [Deltaproteobacteria bacterium]
MPFAKLERLQRRSRQNMLWNKKGKASAAAAAQVARASEAPSEPSDRALDVLGTLIKLYGKYAFDTDSAAASETEAQCNEWATRISLGAPRGGGSANDSQPAAAPRTRDWPGLISFVQGQRRSESEYVVRSISSFRDAILCFADCLGRTLGDEQRSDQQIGKQLDTLSRALETRDPTRICTEAQLVVQSVRSSISMRRQREIEQAQALGDRLRALREELAEARKKAEVDALTQLSNRAAFDDHLSHLATLGALLGEAPCLILADLDHFKSINDNYGHPAGDEVLRRVSHCLSRTFLRKHDFVSRYGGEEFAAVLIDTTLPQAEMLSRRLLDNVRALEMRHGSQEIRATISLGVTALGPGESSASWLARADAALYRAKRGGRDRYELGLPPGG